jgi:hypothetical protein
MRILEKTLNLVIKGMCVYIYIILLNKNGKLLYNY